MGDIYSDVNKYMNMKTCNLISVDINFFSYLVQVVSQNWIDIQELYFLKFKTNLMHKYIPVFIFIQR